jgi:spore coat-associated protein N
MDTKAPGHQHPRRRGRFAALLALALVSGSLGAGALSLAVFTDSQAVTGNAFATGSIDISTTPATALFNVSSMMPGDTNSQTIQVNNAGSGALRYAISTSIVSGPTLAAQLQLDIYAGATCSGTPLYTGALGSAAVGSAAQGANAGDRALAGLTNETLCFKSTLPLSTNNTFQNTSTSVTFTFDGEQTANNP